MEKPGKAVGIVQLLGNLVVLQKIFVVGLLAVCVLLSALLVLPADLEIAHAIPMPAEFTTGNWIESDSSGRFSSAIRAESSLQSTTLDLWSNRVKNVFNILLPRYRYAIEPQCGNELASFNISEATQLVRLYFYSSKTKLPIIEVHLVPHSAANAVARIDSQADDSRQIIITTKLLDQLSTTSELAFVLAHEFAHLQLGHAAPEFPLALLTKAQLARVSDIHRDWEFQADKYAMDLMVRSGIATNSVKELLFRLSAQQANTQSTESRSHPTVTARLEALEKRSRE